MTVSAKCTQSVSRQCVNVTILDSEWEGLGLLRKPPIISEAYYILILHSNAGEDDSPCPKRHKSDKEMMIVPDMFDDGKTFMNTRILSF
jgi:hypothetical protein